MGAIIVAGGQYGSEGKGKIALYLAREYNATAAIRVGGLNSGHTVYKDGKVVKLRMLPTACVTEGAYAIFPAGSYINVDVLFKEMNENDIPYDKVYVDNNAMLVTSEDEYSESSSNLGPSISSTLSGTGNSVIRRIKRENVYVLASFHSDIVSRTIVCDTKRILRDMMNRDECVVVEGTQGYELSILKTKYYPYCTARDTSLSGILSESGLSVRDVDKTCMVFRTFPIRVGGNSGPLPYEKTWDEVTEMAGAKKKLKEFTTVTNKPRRVALFDYDAARAVIEYERPDIIAMNHVDYIDYNMSGKWWVSATQKVWLEDFEEKVGREVDLVGNGPDVTFENNL